MRSLLAVTVSATLLFVFGVSSVALADTKSEIGQRDPVISSESEDPCDVVTCSEYDKDIKCSGSGKTATDAEVACMTDCVYLMPPTGCCVCVSTGPDCVVGSQTDAGGKYTATGAAKNSCTAV